MLSMFMWLILMSLALMMLNMFSQKILFLMLSEFLFFFTCMFFIARDSNFSLMMWLTLIVALLILDSVMAFVLLILESRSSMISKFFKNF